MDVSEAAEASDYLQGMNRNDKNRIQNLNMQMVLKVVYNVKQLMILSGNIQEFCIRSWSGRSFKITVK